MPDTDLNLDIEAPLLNAPPPLGKYLTTFQGRIFVAGIVGAPQDVAFSGYERIFLGRPEESFPPNNRLRLAIGADDVRGMGAVQAGVVIFSKSNEMFMFRGNIEDIQTDEEILYSAVLEQLPWNQGSSSHDSGAETPYGFVWLGSDLTIKIFNGVGEPETLSDNISPLLRRITPGQEQFTRGAFLCYLEREWYMLLCAIDGSQRPNCIVVVDLERDQTKNVGSFPLYFGCDGLEVIEDPNGKNHVIVMALGSPYELTVLSDTVGGISTEYQSTNMNLLAYWRSGYFGIDDPLVMKFWRFLRLVADQPGFRIKLYLVDDDAHSFRTPEIVDFQPADVPLFAINAKTRRISIEIQFPMQDVSANVLELMVSYFPLSAR
jgi:hypothetical protein